LKRETKLLNLCFSMIVFGHHKLLVSPHLKIKPLTSKVEFVATTESESSSVKRRL
jgi:hypothetical protein